MINNILNIMYPGTCCHPRKIVLCGDTKLLDEMERAAESIRGQLISDIILPQPKKIGDLTDAHTTTAIKHMTDISDADMIVAFANESNGLASNPVLFCQMDWISGMVAPECSNSFKFSNQLDEYGFEFNIGTAYEIAYAAGNHKPILIIPNAPVFDCHDELIGSSTHWSGEIPLIRIYDNP